MARYIDADNAIRQLRGRCVSKYPSSFYCGIFASADEIDKLPTADVVEVVRCKDCKHWGGITFGNICRRWTGLNVKNCTKPNDFCSYGERKDT